MQSWLLLAEALAKATDRLHRSEVERHRMSIGASCLADLRRDGATSFEIESEIILIKKKEGGIKKVFGFLGGGGSKKSVSLKDERISQDEFSAEQVSFDVSKLAEGEYELRLKVTDRVANQTAEKSVVLKLERE